MTKVRSITLKDVWSGNDRMIVGISYTELPCSFLSAMQTLHSAIITTVYSTTP